MHVASTPSSPQMALVDHRYGHATLWAATHLTLTLAVTLALIDSSHAVAVVVGGATCLSAVAYRAAIGALAKRPSARRVDMVDLWILIHYQVITVGGLTLFGSLLMALLNVGGG